MVEVVLRRTRHADSLHDTHRSLICRCRERDDLVEPELAKTEIERGGRGLAGIAPAPVLVGQPPANLDTRREMGLERRNRQTDESDERNKLRHLDRPLSEAMTPEVLANPRCHGVALFTAQPTGKELHDPRIGIERGEWFEIGIAPGAKPEPGSLDDEWKRSVHRPRVLATFMALVTDETPAILACTLDERGYCPYNVAVNHVTIPK